MSHSLEKTQDSSAMVTQMQISEAQVAITIRHETSSPCSTVKQGFLAYFFFLYMMAVPFMDLLAVLRVQIINQSQSPFKVNGVFMIIAVVSLSVVTLITLFMVSTSYYIQISSMRDIYYLILKAISCFFAILAPFSLVMVLNVPPSLNWIGYTLICVFLGIMVAFYFAFGSTVSGVEAVLQENNNNKKFPKIYYNGLLVPISLALVLFVPNKLNWIVITVIQLFFWIVIVYIILTCHCLHDFIKTTLKHRQVNPTIQVQQPSVDAVL